MTPLAVIGPVQVTQGACQRVPISGVTMGYLTGQVTSWPYLATGAARSEPHDHPAVTSGSAMTVQCGTDGGVVYPGCTVPGSS